MSGHDFNLRHLRAFCAVCNSGGVSAASPRVHLSQPAITQAIAKLETRLSAALFVRAQRGLSPTPQGALFRDRAERALSILHQGCARALRHHRNARSTALDHAITATHLKALIAVAAHGNFSIAARRQGISQPALHRVARDLERICGFALFEKTRGGIALTPEARGLVRAAKLAFHELDQGIEEVAHSLGRDTVRLTVASLPLARSTLLPNAIIALNAAHPGVSVKVVDGPFDDLLQALREGDVDLMIGALRDPPPSEDVHQEVLFHDALGIYCGPDHPLVGRARVELRHLARYRWVLPKPGTPTRAQFDMLFGCAGLAPDCVRVETSSMILMRGVLRGSDCLTMISATQVEQEVQLGSLWRLPVDLDDNRRPIGLTYRKGWQPTETARALMRLLHDASPSPP